MAEDMSDIINKISSMMGKDNIPDNIKDIMGNLSSTDNNKKDMSSNSSPNITPEMINAISSMFGANNAKTDTNSADANDNSSGFNIDMDTILKIKTVMEKMNSKNDPRSNLLFSLKPYLNSKRKSKVDQYVKLLSMTNLIDVFNNDTGGEHK